MKHIIVLLEGAASSDVTGGKSPLERAQTPELDWLAKRGTVGAVRLLPEEIRLPVEASLLTSLGYDPRQYAGRGAVVAAALRVTLGLNDIAFCCPLIATDGTNVLSSEVEPLTDEETLPLMDLVARRLGTNRLTFYPAPQNNSLLKFVDGPGQLTTTAPRRIQGKTILSCLPEGEEADRLKSLIYDSLELLAEHPINQRRLDSGLLPVNTIWPYGRGGQFFLTSFAEKHESQGAVVSGNILVQGIARAVGLNIVVPPAPGHAALIAATRGALSHFNFVLLPVRVGSGADLPEILQEQVEKVDRDIIATLLALLQKQDEPFRMLIIATNRTISTARVPFLLYDALQEQSNRLPFDERSLPETRHIFEDGAGFIDLLFA